MITSPKTDAILELLETVLQDLSHELLKNYDKVDIKVTIDAAPERFYSNGPRL